MMQVCGCRRSGLGASAGVEGGIALIDAKSSIIPVLAVVCMGLIVITKRRTYN